VKPWSGVQPISSDDECCELAFGTMESTVGREGREHVGGATSDPSHDVWKRLDELIRRAPSLDDLRAHRIHLLAASRWRKEGRTLPEGLQQEALLAAVINLGAASVLPRVCAAVDGPVLAFKGPEVAALYSEPATRPFSDVDVLVPDAERAQQALIAAGFQPMSGGEGYYDGLHHLEPLLCPGFPILVEVHRRPAWPEWLPDPPLRELIEGAVPSRIGIDGLLAPSPSHHALLVAAHAWDFNPLGRLIDLLDVQLLAVEAGRDAIADDAAKLGLGALWSTTLAASDALFGPPGKGRLPRTARSLASARDSTVFGQHVRRWVSWFWILPPLPALRAAGNTLVRDALPAAGETWGSKARRTATAARNGFRRKWLHEAQIGDAARKPPRRSNY